MRYTLLLHYPDHTAEELGADRIEEGMRAFSDYAKSLEEAGVLEAAEVLRQSDLTTTISSATGKLVVQDGPFADGAHATTGHRPGACHQTRTASAGIAVPEVVTCRRLLNVHDCGPLRSRLPSLTSNGTSPS